MRTSRRITTLSAVAAAALAVTTLTAGPAAASGHTILRDGFEGNVPLTEPNATPVIGGVNPAGRGWILDERSRVRVREDGRITVSIRGLIFSNGDPNVVPLVAASLVCGDEVVDSTAPFDLSIPKGNGHVSTRIDVPDDCDDPVVLIRNANNPAGLGGYFAFTD
jgi:hypothetical protein